MAEKLTPALERKWDPRLENWAIWYVGTSAGSASTAAYRDLEEGNYRPEGGQGGAEVYATREPPALIVDALATDSLVNLLPMDLLLALRVWYVWTGTLDARAADLGCHVNTLRNRREAAIIELERLDGGRGRRVLGVVPALVVRRLPYVSPEDVD